MMNDDDKVAAAVAAAIADSASNNAAVRAVVVSRDDLSYAVRLIQARATGQLGSLFWAGKTGSSWTVRTEVLEAEGE